MNNVMCNFQTVDINSNLLKCEDCGRIIQLKHINKKYICGIKIHKLSQETNNISNIKLIKKEIIQTSEQVIKSPVPCSQKQIDTRLDICKTCEFYQNNTCLKCGCSLSRDRVYMNKLYWPDQSCPIGKWGPVPPEES